MTPGTRLPNAPSGGDPLLLPGAYDGLSARILADRFDAAYATGAGMVNVGVAWPDVGSLGRSEAVDPARIAVQAGMRVLRRDGGSEALGDQVLPSDERQRPVLRDEHNGLAVRLQTAGAGGHEENGERAARARRRSGGRHA